MLHEEVYTLAQSYYFTCWHMCSIVHYSTHPRLQAELFGSESGVDAHEINVNIFAFMIDSQSMFPDRWGR